MDAHNNWTLGVVWRWIIWVQDVWGIAIFNRLSYGLNNILLIDGIISVIWKDANEELLISRQKGTDGGTVHKKLKIELNQHIWTDDSIEDINIFLDGQSPGI